MKWKVDLELEDVFGGDGELRYEEREKVKLVRTRTKRIVRELIGTVEQVTEEDIKTKRLEPIHTFRFDEDTPTLRLGGAHGKFWGALKASAKQLWELGDSDFKRSYKSVVDMIIISPTRVPLKSSEDFRVEGIPQVLKGGGGMIVQYYDVIPKVEVSLTIMFPDVLDERVKKLLEQVQVGTRLNKRRSIIKVLNIEDIS